MNENWVGSQCLHRGLRGSEHIVHVGYACLVPQLADRSHAISSRHAQKQRNLQCLADGRVVRAFRRCVHIVKNPLMVDVRLSAANGTGLYANLFWLPTLSPLKMFASSQLQAIVRDGATKVINAPGTSLLARRQYSIQQEWLNADDIATFEILMFSGESSSSNIGPPTPGSAYITVSATYLVKSCSGVL